MNSENNSFSIPLGHHPEENQLLLALERELSPEEFALVEQHLGQCWSCRARYDEMQRGILAFVEYRERRYLPSLRVPPDDYRSFPGRLRAYIGSNRPAGVFARIWQRIIHIFAVPGQVRWATVVATVLAAVLLWTEVLHPPTVSANELLTRAVAAQTREVARQASGRGSTVRQRLQIRGSGKTVVREFEWTPGKPIPHAGWSQQADPSKWVAPLTAEGFVNWRESLREKKDEVSRSGELMMLRTTTAEHVIREASLVVRGDDFRPVRQHLRFADNRELEITELDFQVREDEPLQSGVLQQSPPPSPSVEKPLANLDEVEMQARYALFAGQLDLGEDLRIAQESGLVVVSGIVSSPEREKAMASVLADLPHVRISFRAPGAPGDDTTSATQKTQEGSSSTLPLLKDRLDRTFSSREETIAFVDRCLDVSDTQLSHGWALKRLLDRYSPDAEQHLSSAARDRLIEMVSAHAREIGRRNGELQPLLDLLPGSRTTAPPTPPNWRFAVTSLFAELRRQDTTVASLVVGSRASGTDIAAAAATLRSTHRNIEALARSTVDLVDNRTPQ
jgi:hypothetical protein